MVLEKLERSDKLLDRLHTDLEVQATKEVIKTLESNNLEPNAEQTVKSVQDAYKAASERYADALGIKQDAEVAKNLGYDSAWGKGIRLSLFGEHSGLNPQDMLKAVAKNGLRPGTIIATMTAAHENLASRLRSMDLLNALEQRDELAKEILSRKGLRGNVDPQKLDPQGLEALYQNIRKADADDSTLEQLFNRYTE